ncbi:acyl-CoA thioesterase [Pantoea sp. Acro-805]|uniref:Acyl-CoA thioesterase n=1 Tax=Candidatus Pantoea formicae TaxID=2608355 RepID=A0ABX0QUT8_9GAMM|nr:thioesterase family protein [Pantoea formicae]MDF7647800.1 acyl-CoA thioesterase [Erwiniaceae bacterium L1_54_3]NIE99135.1 acyl-CoA thioesterase [Pantoea formicae]
MFVKHYDVDENHIDFQGVVDGLYYPFYMEWTRHAFMREALGIDIEEEFKQGKLYMVLEYSLRFRKSLVKGDNVEVTCALEKNEKRNRVNFVQQIKVNDVVYADATFVATCFSNGRPSMPEAVLNALAP